VFLLVLVLVLALALVCILKRPPDENPTMSTDEGPVTSEAAPVLSNNINDVPVKSEEPSKEVAAKEGAVVEPETIANGDVASIKNENVPTSSKSSVNDEEEEEEEEDDDVVSEGAQEEDALFTSLEIDEEKEEASHPHDQPRDVKAAPRLLQTAFEKGEVKADEDSESDEKEEKKTESESQQASQPAAESPQHHHPQNHARVSPNTPGTETCYVAWQTFFLCILTYCHSFSFSLRRPNNWISSCPKRPNIPISFPKIWKTCKRP
jgi:hypothetical protein